jgi:hypothetical protein
MNMLVVWVKRFKLSSVLVDLSQLELRSPNTPNNIQDVKGPAPLFRPNSLQGLYGLIPSTDVLRELDLSSGNHRNAQVNGYITY